VVFGIVFDDIDSDGRQDFGEPGLADAIVSRNGVVSVTTTGNGLVTGTFSFSMTQAAVCAFRETNPPGYRSTTPDDVNVAVALGQGYYLEFGDTDSLSTASIYGTVFDDLDADGVQGPAEPGLPGVVVSVTVGGGVVSATTKPYGQYTYGFDVTETGFHTVRERDPALPGYRSTTPDMVNIFVELGQSYVVNFGDTSGPYATIMGTVFDDVSADGVQDPAELGIPDVLVSLSDGQTARTGDHGSYTFPITQSGYLQVVESDPPGYHSTTPNTVTVDVAGLGQVYQVDFGDTDNAAAVSIFGTVFEDQNVNGVRELTEPPIGGVTVTITDTFDAPPAPYVTNQWGQYTFQVDRTGTFTVTETDLPGYVSTGAVPGDPAVTRVDDNTLRAVVTLLGDDLGDNMFGDVALADAVTLTGAVWHDNGAGGGVANDGVRDPGEPGLPGALVTLSSGLSRVTGEDGAFLIYAPPGQPITITETNPPGYVSTGAVPGSGATRVDDDTLLVTARPAGSTSAGHLFGDILPTDLAVAKSAAPDPVAAGGVLTYTLVYTNSGPSDARPVFITDTLSSDLTFGGLVSEEPERFTFSSVGQELVWQAPELTAGVSGTIAFTVTVRPDAVGAVANLVTIASATPDPESGNNSFETLTGVGSPDLATIYGTVFDDLNSSGGRDPGEPGIPSVVVTLDGGTTTTTADDGLYYFLTDVPGQHTVVETDPPGYLSTTPNSVDRVVALGQSYRIDFGDVLAGACVCGPDAFEDDDAPQEAGVLEMGTLHSQEHDFCDDAVDWVTFTARARGFYAITTSSWGQRADTVLALFDRDGETLLAGNDDYENATDYSSSIVWEAPAEGTYYLRVANRGGAVGCYSGYDLWIQSWHIYLPLVAQAIGAPVEAPADGSAAPEATALPLETGLGPTGVISHTCPDAFEPDDTWTQAVWIENDVPQVHSFDSDPAMYVADKDFVWFDVEPFHARAAIPIAFTITHVTNTVPLMTLYDAQGGALNVTGTTQLTWTPGLAGRYYLAVSPLTTTFGCAETVGYRLLAHIPPVRWTYLPLLLR
jgi:uncharacterized repeat protein (TIGR01451 family)